MTTTKPKKNPSLELKSNQKAPRRKALPRQAIKQSESPLARLFNNGHGGEKSFLSATQFAAGEMIRRDFERAQSQARITMHYDASYAIGKSASQNNQALSQNLHVLDAQKRLQAAFDYLEPELAQIIWLVVCIASGFEHAERVMNLPQRSGKAVLAIALTKLARHYGLIKSQKARAEGVPFIWHQEDYRPSNRPDLRTLVL